MPTSKFLKEKAAELKKELNLVESAKSEEDYFRKRSDTTMNTRAEQLKDAKNKAFDTVAIWGLYGKEDIQRYKSFTLPLFMTTAGGPYDSLTDGSLLLSYQTTNDPNKIYSRIDNVNPDHLAWKFAALEGLGIPELTQGLCTSSGMSAIMMATMAFLKSGDNFVSSNRVYGGTQQLFGITYPKSGWNVRWIAEPWDLKQWEKQIDKNTKFLFTEFPSNPTLFIQDLPALAELAHSHNIPLIVDSTLASPALTRPLEHGADIVIHSISKVANGSCRCIGGVIVGKEKITTKDKELEKNFVNNLKGGHFRNMGPCLSPFNSMIIWDEMATIRMRMQEHSRKAMKIAQFLENHPAIESVNYPGLKSHPQHEIAKKLMKFPDGTNGYGYLMSFNIKGGLEKAKKFAEAFDFGVQLTHLGGNYTVWVHNATTTHGQMSAEERKVAGISDNLIRYSVGLEGEDDAIKALDKALNKIKD
ncbi:MAG: aminotransferase class I/II-fold pyridoxal phosphate-dependent enzyme [Nanoarchaeota archaeon]|nr:aminotransferase class I/II-fold pyridoxal phosphate-dependent enzyme [Nanoarchaeota archaeon]